MQTKLIESLKACLCNEKHLLRMQTQEANKQVTRQRIRAIELQILNSAPEKSAIVQVYGKRYSHSEG